MRSILTTIFAFSLSLCAAAQNTLSLEECRALAGANDPYLLNSQLEVLAAREQKMEARALWFPSVSATALGFHSINPLIRVTLTDVLGSSDMANNIKNEIYDTAPMYGITPEYTAMQHGYGATVSVTQPIFAGGRIANGNRLASLGERAAQLQHKIQTKQTASQIEEKYWRVVSLQEKSRTLSEAQEMLDKLYADASSAHDAGILTDSEMLQIQLKSGELRSNGIQLKGGIRLAKMDLFNSIGLSYSVLPGGHTDADGREIPYIDDIVLTDSIHTLEEPSFYYVPEEQQAASSEESQLLAAQVSARELEKKMALGETLPEICVGATYGYGKYISDPTSNGLVYAMVKIPISDWGKNSHKMKRLEYKAQEARNEQKYLDSQLVLRSRQRWIVLNTAWEQYKLAEETLRVSELECSKIESNYKAGLVTLSDLLQARTASSQMRDALTDAAIAYRLALSAYQE